MSKDMTSSRRSFLKSGAIVAAPIAAVGMPAASLAAGDGSKARLARLAAEQAIADLHAELLRGLNTAGGQAHGLDAGLRAIAPDVGAVQQPLAFSEDGMRASARQQCTVQIATELEGNGTFVQMARLQGNAGSIHSENRVLIAEYVKQGENWAIDRVALA